MFTSAAALLTLETRGFFEDVHIYFLSFAQSHPLRGGCLQYTLWSWPRVNDRSAGSRQEVFPSEGWAGRVSPASAGTAHRLWDADRHSQSRAAGRRPHPLGVPPICLSLKHKGVPHRNWVRGSSEATRLSSPSMRWWTSVTPLTPPPSPRLALAPTCSSASGMETVSIQRMLWATATSTQVCRQIRFYGWFTKWCKTSASTLSSCVHFEATNKCKCLKLLIRCLLNCTIWKKTSLLHYRGQ